MGDLRVFASYLLYCIFIFAGIFFCDIVLFVCFSLYLWLLPFFCFVSILSLELCRCSSDLFLSSRPRTGLTTACNTRLEPILGV